MVKAQLVKLAIEVASAQGLPPSWLLAIMEIESNFRADAKRLWGTDGKRGGAYGLCQMTVQTAKGLGFAGKPDELLDPKLNLTLAARLLKQLSSQFGGVLMDVACGYNSGKSCAACKKISETDPDQARRARHGRTILFYAPTVVKFERRWAAELARAAPNA